MEKKNKSEKNVSEDVKPKRKYTKKVKENVSNNENNNVTIETTINIEETTELAVLNEINNVTFEEVIAETNNEIKSEIETKAEKKKEEKRNSIVSEVANARAEILNSERQKALDIISELKDKIQHNIFVKHNIEEVIAKNDEITDVVKEEIKVEKPKEEVELNYEQMEEKLFEQFVAGKHGEVNHFELANTGINLSRFEMLEGRIGKYKLTRPYMGAAWNYTIEK
jgi:hypothetical protein